MAEDDQGESAQLGGQIQPFAHGLRLARLSVTLQGQKGRKTTTASSR
jgi:hypothetical protein